MGKNREIVNKWVAELINDPADMGYRDGDQYKSLSVIWELVSAKTQDVPDSTPKTARDLLRVLGVDGVSTVMTKFEAAAATSKGLEIALGALNDHGEKGGLDFSAIATIAAINQMESEGNISADEASALKAFGVQKASRVTQLNVPNKRYHLRRALEELAATV